MTAFTATQGYVSYEVEEDGSYEVNFAFYCSALAVLEAGGVRYSLVFDPGSNLCCQYLKMAEGDTAILHVIDDTFDDSYNYNFFVHKAVFTAASGAVTATLVKGVNATIQAASDPS